MLVFAGGFPAALSLLFVGLAASAYFAFRLASFLRTRRGKRSAAPARRGLASLALFCGPAVGLILGYLHVRLTGVNPLDVSYTIGQYASLGAIVGLVAAAALGFAGMASDAMEPSSETKKGELHEIE